MTFVDTAGWYAFFIDSDVHHDTAFAWMTENVERLMTTDYCICETLTLMRSRGHRKKAIEYGQFIFSTPVVTTHNITRADIAAAWDIFLRFADKDWSFTDCTSKVVIETLAIPTAFTFDHHFRQFGTVAVVP